MILFLHAALFVVLSSLSYTLHQNIRIVVTLVHYQQLLRLTQTLHQACNLKYSELVVGFDIKGSIYIVCSCCVEFQLYYCDCHIISLTLQQLTLVFYLCRRFSMKTTKNICLTDNIKHPRRRYLNQNVLIHTCTFNSDTADSSVKIEH